MKEKNNNTRSCEMVFESYRNELEAVSQKVIEKIQNFIGVSQEESISNLEFAIPPFWSSGIPASPEIWLYFYEGDKNGRQSDGQINPISELSINFFSDDLRLPVLNVFQFDDQNIHNEISKILMNWFSICWWKAGGWNYSVPTLLVNYEWDCLEDINLTKIKS